MAARKRSTFWLRVVAALVSMVIGIGLMLLATAGVFATATLGGVLFSILTWLAFGVAMSSGLFFTSDCLSEEKREGTLGFLFLTDLRGYDVAGGKLLATSLRGSFALLAVFPILAITLLMGGVTGVQFWQTTLALVNALFCSLAAGLFISAISRDPQKAMAGTLFLLVLWLAGGPLADAILAAVKRHAFEPVFSLSSPFFVFRSASAWGRAPFWIGLLVSQGIAWVLLALASVLVPRTWQERRAARSSFSNTTWSYAWRYGSVRRRAALRRNKQSDSLKPAASSLSSKTPSVLFSTCMTPTSTSLWSTSGSVSMRGGAPRCGASCLATIPSYGSPAASAGNRSGSGAWRCWWPVCW